MGEKKETKTQGTFFYNDKPVFSGEVDFVNLKADFMSDNDMFGLKYNPPYTPEKTSMVPITLGDSGFYYAYGYVKDVSIKVPNKVVEMTFSNGFKTKAVCSDSDTFNFETAINICLLKYLLGGSSKYNNTVSKIVKNYNNKIKAAEAEEKNKELEKQRKAKKQAKYNAYKQRRLDKENERQINIQKEAYVKALKEVSENNFFTMSYIDPTIPQNPYILCNPYFSYDPNNLTVTSESSTEQKTDSTD